MNIPCKLRRLPRGCSSLLVLGLVMGSWLPAQAQDSEVISKLEVVGAMRQPTDTILYKAGIKEGDDLRNVDLTAVMERLWATGAFEDIKFETEDVKEGGRKLTIRVVERPIIKDVDFRGGTEVGLSSLKDKAKEKKLVINPDTVYDPELVRKIKAVIVEEAGEKGYRNPIVDVNLEPMAPGVSRLVFDIKEGGKVHIYKVVFRGNKILSSSQLKSLMKKTREHWMFSWLSSHDKLVDKNMEEDLQNVKKAYWRMGYKDIFVGQPNIDIEDRTSARQKRKNKTREEQGKSPIYDLRATLSIPVQEGDKFYEGTFKLEGNEKVMKGKEGEDHVREQIGIADRDATSPLKKFLNIKPTLNPAPVDKPRIFNLDALNGGLDKVREEYSNMGYIGFKTTKKLDVREENGVKKVDVTVKMDEGEIFTIRHIKFEGNTTTKDKVLRRSLLVREGDPFRMEAFKESFTGLSQLGFFDVKGEDPKIDPVEDKPQVDITIKGEEAGVNELMFNGGFGSVFGFTLGLTFSTRNFGGGGETLSLAYQGGQYSRSYSVGFTEPYIFDLPYSFSVNAGNSVTEYDASKVGAAYAYSQSSRSVGVSVGTRLSTFLEQREDWTYFTTVSTGYSYRLINIDGGQSYIYRDNYHNLLTSSVNGVIAYNTVNHPFKPTRGTKLSFGIDYGGWQFGTDRPFYRTSIDFTKWGNIADRHIFGMNLSYGYMKNLGDQAFAVYDLFRPGGENSIRGYRYGQIGGVVNDNNDQPMAVGGNKQFVANFEYHLKIADQFRVVAFYDAGNAWAPGSSVFSRVTSSYKDYAYSKGAEVSYTNPMLMQSAGIEIRFFMPISPAPMRLIWARKLNPYSWDTSGKTDFQFSMGTTF